MQEINEALEKDSGNGGDVLRTLDKILQELEDFKTECPQTFQHLCKEAVSGSEMSLGDALSALSWVTDYLAECK